RAVGMATDAAPDIHPQVLEGAPRLVEELVGALVEVAHPVGEPRRTGAVVAKAIVAGAVVAGGSCCLPLSSGHLLDLAGGDAADEEAGGEGDDQRGDRAALDEPHHLVIEGIELLPGVLQLRGEPVVQLPSLLLQHIRGGHRWSPCPLGSSKTEQFPRVWSPPPAANPRPE